jgi:uncharacterized DUF497 family protein
LPTAGYLKAMSGLVAAANAAKHGLTFGEAATAFGDTLSITIADPHHSATEERFVLLGETLTGTLVVVVHAEREDNVRIISASRATPSERRDYEDE